MSEKTDVPSQPYEDPVVQDGVPCPRSAPWSPRVSNVTTLLFIPIIVLAVYILAQTSSIKLVLWLLIFGIFVYPLRYLVCARCPYYGQTCSTHFGRIVPHLFEKQEGKSMKVGLWLDVVCFTALFLLPLPEAWQVGGIVMILIWIVAFSAAIAIITRLACSVCPFAFCPIGKAGRAIWKPH